LEREQRRLAAILVADVVGYSKLVAGDEAGTLAKLSALKREVLEPARASGSLATFTSRTSLPVSSTMQTLVCLTDTSNPANMIHVALLLLMLEAVTTDLVSPSA
jgi:hypothetical protein